MSPKMHIAISGATGLIGSHLSASFRQAEHRVTHIVRRRLPKRAAAKPSTPRAKAQGRATTDAKLGPVAFAEWDRERPELLASDLSGVDCVIHLAGEPIASGRWNRAKKERIRTSRVEGTASVVDALRQMECPPKHFLCASGVGFYGDRGEEELDEMSSAGEGFLAEVCQDWEAAAQAAAELGARVVNLRFGLVMTPVGGALARMLPPFRAGLGGALGSGAQYLAWITLQDALAAITHLATDDTLSGPFNLAAPGSCTNLAFVQSLARQLRRPALLPVPSWALRLALGDLADEALLASQRALPRELLRSGFTFSQPDLPAALVAMLR